MKNYLLAGVIALAFLGCDAEVVTPSPDAGAEVGGGTSNNDASPMETPSATSSPLTISVWCGGAALPGDAPLTAGFQGAYMLFYQINVPALAGQDVESYCQLWIADEAIPEEVIWISGKIDATGMTRERMIFLDWSKDRVEQETASPTAKTLVCGIRTSAGATEHVASFDVVLR